MEASNIPIDSTIILLQLLHILIWRAILATEENKRIFSNTHHAVDQEIHLTLSPLPPSPQIQNSTVCPCGVKCWYMQDPFRIKSNRCDM